jgi:hypothetical protein
MDVWRTTFDKLMSIAHFCLWQTSVKDTHTMRCTTLAGSISVCLGYLLFLFFISSVQRIRKALRLQAIKAKATFSALAEKGSLAKNDEILCHLSHYTVNVYTLHLHTNIASTQKQAPLAEGQQQPPWRTQQRQEQTKWMKEREGRWKA